MVEWNVLETIQKLDLVIPTHVLHVLHQLIVFGVIGPISVIALLLVVVEFRLELDTSLDLLQMVEWNVLETIQKPDLVIPTHVILYQFLCLYQFQYLLNVYTVIGQIGVLVLFHVVEEFKLELEIFSIFQTLL